MGQVHVDNSVSLLCPPGIHKPRNNQGHRFSSAIAKSSPEMSRSYTVRLHCTEHYYWEDVTRVINTRTSFPAVRCRDARLVCANISAWRTTRVIWLLAVIEPGQYRGTKTQTGTAIGCAICRCYGCLGMYVCKGSSATLMVEVLASYNFVNEASCSLNYCQGPVAERIRSSCTSRYGEIDI